MKARVEFTLDEIQRTIVASGLIMALVIAVFYSIHLGFTTVKSGVTKTAEETWARFETVLGRFITVFEDLLMHSDDLGRASLFEQFPFPARLTVDTGDEHSGTRLVAVESYDMEGVNLDRALQYEVRIDGASDTETLQVEDARRTPAWAEGEQFEVKSRTTVLISPLAATARVVAITGETQFVFELPVVKRFSSRSHATQLSKTGTHPTGTGPGESPGPTAAPTPPPDTTIVVSDTGATALASWLESEVSFPAPRRTVLAGAARAGSFSDGQVLECLDLIRQGPLDQGQQRVLVKTLLAQPYMTRRLLNNQPSPLHGLPPHDVEILAKEFTATAIRDSIINSEGRVMAGVGALMTRLAQRPVDTTPAASATPTSGPLTSATPGSEGPRDRAFYDAVWAKEEQRRDCASVIEVVQKAYKSFTANSLAKPELDLGLLRRKGFLSYIPRCPESAGTYLRVGAEGNVGCSIHGTLEHPWDERARFVKYFGELEKARNVIRSQGTPADAIRILQSLVSREPDNDRARAAMGTLMAREQRFDDVIAVLRPLVRARGASIAFYFWVGTAFYGKDNFELATENLKVCVEMTPETMLKNRELIEDIPVADLYRMQDEARWMLENLQRKVKSADGTEETRPPVKYLEFKARNRPRFASVDCFARLQTARDVLPKILTNLRRDERPKEAMVQVRELKAKRAALAAYQTDERVALEGQLLDLRRELRDLIANALRESGPTTLGACPTRGVFHVEPGGKYPVDCTIHSEMLTEGQLAVEKAPDETEHHLLSLALQYLVVQSDEGLRECLVRQARLLNQFTDPQTQLFTMDRESSLAELVRQGRITQNLAECEGNGPYSIVERKNGVRLECPKHLGRMQLQQLFDGITFETTGEDH